ncbi:5-dehydro-2-deoxygluconokinase [Halalkalibacterium halodurans]|jgi:5-dehydro-2-deoxygluconokinase|uniref:5-dehydro-2-deoxygluconokinase n=3 Tax=Halalkalibacterium halodurans TaxID=86665 RepID=IOLC_HALH5|nr:5-dehydro-2-deoxygluconokinase [Halalkalibacterium halodurans]Q9KAG8.1 RecName: Full=5-dehydro-2-deoxygluconokinase; AltName: Full=2-deoxy-5-keto-D-gluconate kinase; Short=DKG kinase [Halalkalibacterium halodurans C-125]MDY7222871.1 5-dehydro-2-deoxygluconokinase [Halalkalibacterium halodurans]MDY7242092.1 5-dehydro-2-deoxygluconokinase [Halalkalibacterium halodurans]MED3648117.1 5-dehydro-2-deoxygluconokinase [Halalkalibacterium halodurans]MED4080898.1 5-dehydro-2-deoxygluconokinase [Halal
MTYELSTDREFDLIAIGRACIDLNAVEYNRPMEETMTFSKYVGGSPANIVIGSSKLGLKAGFIGKIADDQHGRFIESYMRGVGVDTSNLVVDQEGHKTGLAFTEIKSPEECSILMYRQDVADLYLSPEEVNEAYIRRSKLLLVSGTALSKSPSREAVLKAIRLAKRNDVKVVFELDYRPYSWETPEETAVYYSLVAEQSDIVIGTREEFDVLENRTEKGDNDETIRYLFKHSPELIVIKHGVEGSFAYTKAGEAYRGYAYKTKVLKTFGAGDSYASAFLYALISGKGIETALKYGSASASIVVSKHSSSDAMPSVEEIEALIEKDETITIA